MVMKENNDKGLRAFGQRKTTMGNGDIDKSHNGRHEERHHERHNEK